MTRDEAIAFVEVMVRALKPSPPDPAMREWLETVGFHHEFSDKDTRPTFAFDPDRLPDLLEAAKTVPAAFDAACKLAALHVGRAREMPPDLAAFAIGRIYGTTESPKRKKSRTGGSDAVDVLIVAAMDYLIRHGSRKGQNVTSTHSEDAASVVASALAKAGYPTLAGDSIRRRYDAIKSDEKPKNTSGERDA